MTNPLRPLRNNRGIALLVALFSLTLMIFVAIEVSYDTSVEYIMARQQVNRIKAYYAAKAGLEISLLRVQIYKKAVASYGEQLGSNISMLDPIWQIPFTWPPALPEDMDAVDKSNVEDVVKESSMDAQYAASIESEGGKIDLNDLGSASKPLREATKQQLLKLFRSEVENNEEFSKKYRDFRFDELVNNMIDWVDEDKESLNGGDEASKYRDIRSEFIPPNAPFKTLKELNQVADMNQDIFDLLSSRVTIFGTKGINVNYAPKEVLAALDPSMNEEVVSQVLKRRSDPNEGGPFQNEEDFLGFIQRYGANVQAIQKAGVPLLFGVEFNFRVRSDGRFGNVTRNITAITFDLANLKDRYLQLLDKEAQDQQAPGGVPSGSGAGSGAGTIPNQPNTEKTKITPPKGRPTVVYWEET